MTATSGLRVSKLRNTVPGLILCIFLLSILWVSAAHGMEDESLAIDWAQMGMGLIGGLALFLFGMDQLGDGLKAAAGESMKVILAKFTKNRVLAAVTGAAVTAVIQSSSITTVLVVGFVSAGIMTLTQSIGVIMGANVGTTVTAQIVAFKVDELALGLIAVGFLMNFVGKTDQIRHIGSIVMGLGLIFFGMSIMSDAMYPLRGYPPFMDTMASLESPLPAILLAALFTALIQSSSATTGIVIVMASGGLISLHTGIAMALGANIGTCVTACLAAIGKPVEAQRAAVVHILFNVIGVSLWILFIQELADVSRVISPVHEELSGPARLAAETPRQIANANTLFNIANTVVLLGFAGYIGKLAEKLVPEKPAEEKFIIKPEFLDEELLNVPAMALQRVRFEVGNLGALLKVMMEAFQNAIMEQSSENVRKVRIMDDKVDVLFSEIVGYLGKIRKHELSDDESLELQHLLHAGNNMEAIGDTVSERLTSIAETWLAKKKTASETTRMIIRSLYQAALDAVEGSTKAVREGDQVAALAIVSAKADFERLVEEAIAYQSERIALDDPEHLETIRLEMDLIHTLRHIFFLSRRIAKSVVPTAVFDES